MKKLRLAAVFTAALMTAADRNFSTPTLRIWKRKALT